MRVCARIGAQLTVAAVVVTTALAGNAQAARPAAACQPFSAAACLFPFPDNRFTRSDPHSRTGLRVHLPAAAMPVNVHGARIAVAPYDRADGFSPGSAIVLHVPGLDSDAAMTRTGAAPLSDPSRALRPNQPIIVIDEAGAASSSGQSSTSTQPGRRRAIC